MVNLHVFVSIPTQEQLFANYWVYNTEVVPEKGQNLVLRDSSESDEALPKDPIILTVKLVRWNHDLSEVEVFVAADRGVYGLVEIADDLGWTVYPDPTPAS